MNSYSTVEKIADKAEVSFAVLSIQFTFDTFSPGLGRQGFAEYETSVFSAEPDGAAAVPVDQIGDLHIDFPGQHHFDEAEHDALLGGIVRQEQE